MEDGVSYALPQLQATEAWEGGCLLSLPRVLQMCLLSLPREIGRAHV